MSKQSNSGDNYPDRKGQCAKSKTGREQAIEWLKHLENNELRRAAGQAQATYDSSWKWEELILAKHQYC